MNMKYKNLAIYGNDSQGSHLAEIGDIFSLLKEIGGSVSVERAFASYLKDKNLLPEEFVITDSIGNNIDAVLSIGGDGTFLRAAEWVGAAEKPVLGINTGHLGYLAGFSADRLAELAEALSGGGKLTRRMMLEIEGDCVPRGFVATALNEVVVTKGDTVQMVCVRAYADDFFVAEYMADGLVVSTPTGSTAYNMSVGGPILEPSIEGIILSPIAPHSLTMRPLVVGADSRIRLEISSRGKECHIALDGRLFPVSAAGSQIVVRRSSLHVNVVFPQGTDFAGVLRKKLLWGRR
ncbi:MAG: NAD(+)/NADH kinase [Candidatus Amulumruptor caecigallinarius]|nr:NAD(+)/NADH kinase [Candidatus Amulumruptor caecigallinarius]